MKKRQRKWRDTGKAKDEKKTLSDLFSAIPPEQVCNCLLGEVTTLTIFDDTWPPQGLSSAPTFPYGLRLRIDTAITFPLAGGRGPSNAPIERLGNSTGFPVG
jgi:hypothetical protein